MNITTENRISDIAEAVSRDFHADRRQQNADNWVFPENKEDLMAQLDRAPNGMTLGELKPGTAGEFEAAFAKAQAIIARRLSEPVPHLRTFRDVPAGVEAVVLDVTDGLQDPVRGRVGPRRNACYGAWR